MQNLFEKSNALTNQLAEEKQSASLDTPGVTASIARKLLHDINGYAIKTYHDPMRWHLGASLIGHECSRYLWYTFRWCGVESGKGFNDEEKHQNLGRLLRLFNRGHREEDRYAEYLKGIGCEVWTHDQNGHQFRMSAVKGHFGGSLDGIAKLPQSYNIPEPILLEYKTNGTGQGFVKLKEDGVSVAKHQHFLQMNCYGADYKLNYAGYLNTNKNDDDMHIEIVKLNHNLAEQMKHKAERIILTDEPPPKLSLDPKYYQCGYCPMKPQCHEGKPPLKNCRSCVNARPADNAEWFCNVHQNIIPRDFVPRGCESYKAIVNG